MMDVRSVHHDVKVVEESASNVDVYGGVVDDGMGPSGTVQTCERTHIHGTARRYDVCLLK